MPAHIYQNTDEELVEFVPVIFICQNHDCSVANYFFTVAQVWIIGKRFTFQKK